MATTNNINDYLALEEIYALYASTPAAGGFCPQSRLGKILVGLKLKICSCSLCTAERIARTQVEMTRKLCENVKVSRGSIKRIGAMNVEMMKHIKMASGIEISIKEMMKAFSIMYLESVRKLISDPFMPIEDTISEFEENELLLTITFKKLLLREIRCAQPRCYQVYTMNKERLTVLYGRDVFNKENLVGIEHNPGPNMLLSYLKNMEKIEERASTVKRTSRVAKSIMSAERVVQKKKQLELRQRRAEKLHQLQAQGMFDSRVNIDETTKLFLSTLLSEFASKVSNITVKHEVGNGLFSSLEFISEYLSTCSSKIYNLMVSFIKIVVKIIAPTMLNLIDYFFSEEDFHDAVEAQMDLPLQSFMMSLYASSLCGFILKGDWENFTNTISRIKSDSGKNKSVIETVKNILGEMAEFVFETTGVKIPFLYQEDILISELQAEAKIIWNQYSTGCIDDYAFADRVCVFINEIENHLYERRKTVSLSQKEKLQYLLKKFTPVMQYCSRYVNPNNGPRIEPLAIMIGGPTGVGKSTFTVPFLLALMSRILPKDKKEQFMTNHNDFLFFRANENEFWDGYKMRNVAIVYDDFGQMKDCVGAPSADAFEIIRLKNTAPYHLHFAAIEDKQRNFAVPKLIFATTNLHKLYFEGLTCSEAVARRFDMAYIQVPRLEFCKDGCNTLWERRLDLEKVRSVYPENEDDPSTLVALDVAEFVPWDFSRGEQLPGKALGFWELLDVCEQKFNTLNHKGDKMLNFHKFLKGNPYPVAQMNVPFSMKQASKMFADGISAIAEGSVKYVSKISLDKKAQQFMMVAGTVFVGAFSTYALFNKNISVESGTDKVQHKKTELKQRNQNRGRNAARVNRAHVRPVNGVITQAGDTRVAPYLKMLKRNMYKLSSSETSADFGWVLFLFDRTFLIPRHFLLTLDSCANELDHTQRVEVQFKHPVTGVIHMCIDWERDTQLYDFEEDGARDYVIMQISESKCRLHADITDMFVDTDLLRHGDKYKSQMVVSRDNALMFLLPEVRINLNDKYEYKSGVSDVEGKEILVYAAGIAYSAPTEVGDCGSLLLTMDSRFNRPTILGMHTAGSSGLAKQRLGLGTIIPSKTIKNIVFQLKPTLKGEEIKIDGSEIEGFGALHEAKQPRVPNKSKIEKSVLSEELWETTTVPAHLTKFVNSQGNEIDPALKARIGYSHNEVFVEAEILDFCTNLVSNLVLTKIHSAPWEPRIFSFREAVSGVQGVEYVDAINRSTSPGYPYVLNNKTKGKSFWFGSDGDIDFSDQNVKIVESNVLSLVEKASRGIRSENVYVDYLKDERRLMAKVDEGKTRQFMACGMDYLIAVKMYFGDFIRHVCQNRIQNGIAVGINPYTEWSQLADYLTAGLDKYVTAGDYSKYDARIPVCVGYAVLEVIENFYYNSTDTERLVRQILFLDIVNSLHLSRGIVYEFVGGNPSGEPMTTVFNSVANLIMLAYVGNVNAREQGFHDEEFAEIFARSRFSTFGDDNLIAHLPCDESIFGQQAIEKNAFRLLGMDYTNEAKDGKELHQRRLADVNFLKRGFRYENGIYHCPLELSVLKETLSWQKEGATDSEMKLRVECVCSELARHGKLVFDDHAPRIVRAMQKHFDYTPRNNKFVIAISSGDSLAFAN